MRSKNIKFDVMEGQLASNKISDIKSGLKKKRVFRQELFSLDKKLDQNEAKSFF